MISRRYWPFVSVPATMSNTSVKDATIVGTVTGVATPIATVVVPKVIGFGAAGIAKGTIAAQMMSSAALANGGATAAGGTVATLQSIGAVGLSASGVLPLVAVGTAVGVGGYYGYKFVRSKL